MAAEKRLPTRFPKVTVYTDHQLHFETDIRQTNGPVDGYTPPRKFTGDHSHRKGLRSKYEKPGSYFFPGTYHKVVCDKIESLKVEPVITLSFHEGNVK